MAGYKPMPPYDELSRHLKYDPFTGVGTWIVSLGAAKAGRRAGSLNTARGYLDIRYKGKDYRSHRLFWFLQTGHDPGTLTIDHIDRNKLNNKFCNLRLASLSQQEYNKFKRLDNTSGHRGVSWNKTKQRYQAYIKYNKKSICLGHYKTFEQAIAARQAKELKLFGEFSPLYRLNNDQLLPDHDQQQLSVLWHPSFRGCATDC